MNMNRFGKGFVRKGFRLALTYAVGRERCLCCGRETFDMPLCRKCMESYMLNFVRPGAGRCSRCGKILLSEIGSCTTCRTKPVIKTPDSVFPLYPYRLWRKKLLAEWKLHGRRSLSSLFARLFSTALREMNLDKDNSFIVPVPPRPGKIRLEGWDQIMELASFLKADYGYPVLPLLKRTSILQQKEKNRRERMETVNRSYHAVKGATDMIRKSGFAQRDAVLIDDVITTGITVEECALRLRELGIRKVHVLSLFIVD